jgi:hypothetical protein
MKHLLLIYDTEKRWAQGYDKAEIAEYRAFGQEHASAILGGHAKARRSPRARGHHRVVEWGETCGRQHATLVPSWQRYGWQAEAVLSAASCCAAYFRTTS